MLNQTDILFAVALESHADCFQPMDAMECLTDVPNVCLQLAEEKTAGAALKSHMSLWSGWLPATGYWLAFKNSQAAERISLNRPYSVHHCPTQWGNPRRVCVVLKHFNIKTLNICHTATE